MTCRLLLEFYGDIPQLTKTFFQRDDGRVITAVRGKTAGAVPGAGTFQWSSAVKALCSICIRALLTDLYKDSRRVATLSGLGGSLAATLDYALSKQPSWTVDMFGVDGCAQSYLRRMLLRTNSDRKYPGPVIVSLNPKVLNSDNVLLSWNGDRLTTATQIRDLLTLLEGETSEPIEDSFFGSGLFPDKMQASEDSATENGSLRALEKGKSRQKLAA